MAGNGDSKLSKKNNGLVTRHVQHCVCANKSDNLLFIQVVEGVYPTTIIIGDL